MIPIKMHLFEIFLKENEIEEIWNSLFAMKVYCNNEECKAIYGMRPQKKKMASQKMHHKCITIMKNVQ